MQQTIPLNTDSSPDAVLELLFKLKIKDVMTTGVFSASPRNTMREIQLLMKRSRVTGVPVVEDGRTIVGIISMEDIVNAFDGGWMDDIAQNHMTQKVIVMQESMPVSFCITYFNKYRFGRFPVVDKDSKLTGIVTTTDVISALLVAMNKEVERLERESVSAPRTAAELAPGMGQNGENAFARGAPLGGIGAPNGSGVGGVVSGAAAGSAGTGAAGGGGANGNAVNGALQSADSRNGAFVNADCSPTEPVVLEFKTEPFNFETAGQASTEIKKRLKALHVDPALTRRIGIASYELEINQVVHSMGGVMRYVITPDALTIEACDMGPGIPDISKALTEGFSTATDKVRALGFGAGMGLPNTKRVSDRFSIASSKTEGTTVSAVFELRFV